MPRIPTGQPVMRLSITMPTDTVRRLREITTGQGITAAEGIRRAVEAWIEAQGMEEGGGSHPR